MTPDFETSFVFVIFYFSISILPSVKRLMLLNVSLLDIWGSGSLISVEACFILRHYFCLYTLNVDLGSVPLAPSLSAGPSAFLKGCIRHASWERCTCQWLQSNL